VTRETETLKHNDGGFTLKLIPNSSTCFLLRRMLLSLNLDFFVVVVAAFLDATPSCWGSCLIVMTRSYERSLTTTQRGQGLVLNEEDTCYLLVFLEFELFS